MGPYRVELQEALGIRMFLYSTIIAQIVFTLKSEFVNPIGLEMVENVSRIDFCVCLGFGIGAY